MTKQILKSTDRKELFNIAYIGVLAQGTSSVIPKGYGDADTCAYQDHSGNKCGVGHTLTDEALDKVSSFVGSATSMLDEFDYDEGFEQLPDDRTDTGLAMYLNGFARVP